MCSFAVFKAKISLSVIDESFKLHFKIGKILHKKINGFTDSSIEDEEDDIVIPDTWTTYLNMKDIDLDDIYDDYKDKSFTGDDLDIPIHYLDRSHGWSTTKFKKLIAEKL